MGVLAGVEAEPEKTRERGALETRGMIVAVVLSPQRRVFAWSLRGTWSSHRTWSVLTSVNNPT